MPAQVPESVEGLLEECIDELDVAIENLERFPELVLAFAMRTHLAALLRALADASVLGAGEVRDFLARLEADVTRTDAEEQEDADDALVQNSG